MGWCGNHICLAFKKEYKLLHDESETLVPIHVDFKSSPLIKVCLVFKHFERYALFLNTYIPGLCRSCQERNFF
jgi:hypothetical protein